MPLLGTDYVEFYVGNKNNLATILKQLLISIMLTRDLKQAVKDVTSYVLIQNKIKIVLTTPLNSKSLLNNHIKKHGDGVKVIAFMGRRRKFIHGRKLQLVERNNYKSFMSPQSKRKMSLVRRDTHLNAQEFIHMEKPN